ncbi:MAG TPA: hypothetical protein VGJ60_17770, partial [Chloroflexota bacterium]
MRQPTVQRLKIRHASGANHLAINRAHPPHPPINRAHPPLTTALGAPLLSTDVLSLQRTVGNQATMQALGQARTPPEATTTHIHRHSAFEHYLLGKVAPDDLA